MMAISHKARAAVRTVLMCTMFLLPVLALAAQVRTAGCDIAEPDSLEISWTAPCRDGSWRLDPRVGCRLWEWHPDPEDSATWSGVCKSARKEGRGVVQWYEHGRPVDRFEGAFLRGKREGLGRYQWPAGQDFHGTYVADLPDGQGTVIIDGASYSGIWRRGCLTHGDKRIAIGVPLGTCVGQ